MRSSILTVLMTLSFYLVNAQYQRGTIVFKDSTKLEGLIKVKYGDRTRNTIIMFKDAENAKETLYDDSKVIGYGTENEKHRYFRYISNEPKRLLKEVLKGKVSLYSRTWKVLGGGLDYGYYEATQTAYYILFDNKLIRIGSRFRNKHLKLFDKCKSLQSKIDAKELKKSEVYEIIKHYNKNCD